ncbi:amidohydrolase [Endozoicomonas sp.]|uniref:amidohydrolase n=1 Tax=Endozoicomonas sp. TaxID=1892382 RepID=UPI00383B78B9
MLNIQDISNCVILRKKLHQKPELANFEKVTSALIKEYMTALMPDNMITDIGGTGIAIGFGSKNTGPTIMLRCELDALPINECIDIPHASCHPGISHKCGHDGHMAILAAVAHYFSVNKPEKGRVILLFQPAEETGEGARKIVSSSEFEQINPDYIFSLHNVPGYPKGQVLIKPDTFCCASRGLIIFLRGTPAHAAQPETGISPVLAINELITAIHTIPETVTRGSELTFATIVGVDIGAKAFGTSPEKGYLYVTLRSDSDENMNRLVSYLENKTTEISTRYRLQPSLDYEDVFDATVNSPEAVSIIETALAGEPVIRLDRPFRWSEDFGLFNQKKCGAMFGLGAGTTSPALHSANYDFQDELIECGSRYFIKIVLHCFDMAIK